MTRRLGSSALALAYVGAGRFDAFAQTHGLSAWDVAAAGLIAERPAPSVTDATGGPWFDLARGTRTFGVVAAPPAHHARLLELVRAPPAWTSVGRSALLQPAVRPRAQPGQADLVAERLPAAPAARRASGARRRDVSGSGRVGPQPGQVR